MNSSYEHSEKKALQDGKAALAAHPHLFDRSAQRSKGFFFELKANDAVHPGHYAVHCVDGAGTKLFLSAWSGNYGLAPIDALAMNANDMATAIHALPDTVNLYFAVQQGVEREHMGDIMAGFARAMETIRIPGAPFAVNLGKIETASHDETVALGVPDKGWDVGVAMLGYIPRDKVPLLTPRPGHIIVGVASSGAHSNGYTEARHVLLTSEVEYRQEWKSRYRGRFGLDHRPGILAGLTVLEALQTPTFIYLAESAAIGRCLDHRDIYGVNITGGGLANFNRAGRGVSFEISDPLELLPIHRLLVQESAWSPQEAYSKQNMGMGFAYIVPTLEMAEETVKLIAEHGEHRAQIIGEVRAWKGEGLRTILHNPYEGPPVEYVGY